MVRADAGSSEEDLVVKAINRVAQGAVTWYGNVVVTRAITHCCRRKLLFIDVSASFMGQFGSVSAFNQTVSVCLRGRWHRMNILSVCNRFITDLHLQTLNKPAES